MTRAARLGLLLMRAVACAWLCCCSAPAADPGRPLISSAIQSNGVRRTFLLSLPRGHTTAGDVPLLLAFHGAGGTGSGMRQAIDIEGLADRYGVAVVYPDAAPNTRNTWALGCPNCTWADVAGIDDYRFARDLVDSLARRYPIDTAHVFALGVSLGGSFAHDLACRETSLLAGVAVVAALPSADELPVCRAPTRPITMLLMIGDQDPNVPVGGGGAYDYLSADSTARFWAARDECSGGPIESSLPDANGDGQVVRVTAYALCSASAVVHRFIVEGGGHTWPTGELQASSEIARTFFSSDGR